jgi:hypothetical protein
LNKGALAANPVTQDAGAQAIIRARVGENSLRRSYREREALIEIKLLSP